MAIRLQFDSAKIVKTPTIVLSKRSGKKLGTIPVSGVKFDDNFNSGNNIDFSVFKSDNKKKVRLWDQIKDFKLIWCKEWDAWFAIEVETSETNELEKKVSGTSLGEAELSAIKIYGIEINTEDDIARDDYIETILHNPKNNKASLLHRITEKCPHYSIKHVDSSIANIQRTFSFDNISIYDAFQEISDEIGCIFILSQGSDINGLPERGIYVYDLQNVCNVCGHRGEFISKCPECGGIDITSGYGEDTSVFISNENIAKEITLTTDIGSVNNCFRMETGDDLMTATVASCNPNGTQYLYYISDDMKSDMSDELIEKIEKYNNDYSYYQSDYQINLEDALITSYNNLVLKYKTYDEDLESISKNDNGFSSLISTIYNAIDFELYLTSGLMPSPAMTNTTAALQSTLLNIHSLSPIAVSNINSISASTVNSNILSLAKTIVKPTYKVEIKSSTFNVDTKVWTGIFTLTNYSDDEDTADTPAMNIRVTGDYEQYVKQKIEKKLNSSNTDNYEVSALFEKSLSLSYGAYVGGFADEIKKYGLNPLNSFRDNCQSCLDILIEEGISDNTTWSSSSTDLYSKFYSQYYLKLQALENEIALREKEINIIDRVLDSADNIRINIQNSLNFQDYLGEELWKEFCSYRRETEYSNSNYISDGLSNSELLERARDFLDIAENELIKSATLQHSISTSLNNLLVIPGFEKILDSFAVGNWLRVRIDGEIYKLRLINYSVDFDNLDDLSVEFSDVQKYISSEDINVFDDAQSIISQAKSMATSYQGLERQSSKSEKTTKTVDSWFKEGLNATLTKIINDATGQTMTWDSHGLLMRKYDEVSETHDDEQLKIINSTLAITDDNWSTTKTAIGKFYYVNPTTGELETAYGVNGETIVGKLIIGEGLALYNSSGSLTFDQNGFSVTNEINTFNINPNNSSIVQILRGQESLFGLDAGGNLFLTGEVNAIGGFFGSTNPFIISDSGLDGTASLNVRTDNVYKEDQFDLYTNGSYANSFTIEIIKSGETNALNNMELSVSFIDLAIPYYYTVTTTTSESSVNDSSSETGAGSNEDDDSTINENSNEITTTTTTTTTYTDVITINILNTSTDVTNSIYVTLESGTKTYRYTYRFGQSDMVTYLRTLIRNNNPNISNDYPLTSIQLTGAAAIVSYNYHFTSFNSYTHIGTDYLSYSEDLVVRNGKVTLGVTTINDLTVTKNIILGGNTFIRGTMASNDYWRLLGGGSSDSGYLEIATADNGNEPIYIRQYSGVFASLTRTLTLLDSSGNTILPGILKVGTIQGTGSYVNFGSSVVFQNADTWLGGVAVTTERRLRFAGTQSGTYKHNAYIYGGNTSSTTAIGIYDSKNGHSVLVYNDVDNTLSVAGVANFYFKDWSGTTRKPIATYTKNTARVAYIGSKSSGLTVGGQWGGTAISNRTVSVAASDIRLKENIKPSEVKSALDTLSKFVMYSFDWKENKEHQKIGFVADQLETVDPLLSVGGGYEKDGTMNAKCVNDFYMLGYVVKAIQELYEMMREVKK